MYTPHDDLSTTKGERGYPWLFLSFTPARVKATLITVLVLSLSGAGYIWYSQHGKDPYPDSTVGLAFAVAGTFCFACAGILYTLRRRSRKRAVGKLNGALQWHIAFAVMALALLFMHSFGNFNPRSGTYALCGMIAMVISGFVGRALDHFMPRLMAHEVQKALTPQGDDRMKTISRKLEEIVTYNTQRELPFGAMHSDRQAPLNSATVSWDLAYISLEETPQELSRREQHYRFVPDKKSALVKPGALIPGVQTQLSAIKDVEKALQREQFYRYVIRYWRVVHICIALATLGLTLWHIEYAITLWLPH